MILSSTSEYALRAMLSLARRRRDTYHSIREVSEELDISFPFLTKVFQKLAAAGIVETSRGKYGGVTMARPAREITLFDILVATDSGGLFTECVLGLPGCGQEKPCPMHGYWAIERERIKNLFQRRTLAEMANRMDRNEYRLKARPGDRS